METKFVCPVCNSFARKYYGGILRHIGAVHRFDPNFRGLGTPKCPSTYTKFESFRSHIYKKHRNQLYAASHDPCHDEASTSAQAVNDHEESNGYDDIQDMGDDCDHDNDSDPDIDDGFQLCLF